MLHSCSKITPKKIEIYFEIRNTDLSNFDKQWWSLHSKSLLYSLSCKVGSQSKNVSEHCWFCILKLETPQVMAPVHCMPIAMGVSLSLARIERLFDTVLVCTPYILIQLQDCQLSLIFILSSHIAYWNINKFQTWKIFCL